MAPGHGATIGGTVSCDHRDSTASCWSPASSKVFLLHAVCPLLAIVERSWTFSRID